MQWQYRALHYSVSRGSEFYEYLYGTDCNMPAVELSPSDLQQVCWVWLSL